MFIEASRPRVTGDKARLISPLYNITAKYYCVSFYYHMYGKHIGEYPPGMGNPSLVQAVGEDLQPLALPAVPAASSSVGVALQCSKRQGGLLLSDTCPLPTPQQCQGCKAVVAHPRGSILQSAITPSLLAHSSSSIRLPALHKKALYPCAHFFLLTATATLLQAAGHQVNSLSIREETEVEGLCGTGGLCGGHSYFGVGRMCVPSAVPRGCLLCLTPSSLTVSLQVQRAPQTHLAN